MYKREKRCYQGCTELFCDDLRVLLISRRNIHIKSTIVISDVCDLVGEERYNYKNIYYFIQESPVKYFKCFYSFIFILERCDIKENVDISINNVVGIEEGNWETNFSKYYFVILKQSSLDTLAFEEKLGKDISEVKYDKRRIIISG